MKKLEFVKKITAAGIALALLLEAPGLRAYAAMGEMSNPGGESAAPLGKIEAPLSFNTDSVNPADNLVPASQIQAYGLSLTPQEKARQTLETAVARQQLQAKLSGASEKTQNRPALVYDAVLRTTALVQQNAASQKTSGGFFSAKFIPALKKALSPSSLKNFGSKARKTLSGIFDGENGASRILPGPDGRSFAVIERSAVSSSRLSPSVSYRVQSVSPSQVPAPSSQTPTGPTNPQKSFAAGFALSSARVIFSAAAVIAVQVMAVHFLPAVFGLVGVASVWAVMGGLLAMPAALYTRYRLSRHDAPRLNKVKWILDAAIGGLIGASVLAFPVLATAISAPVLPALMSLAALSGVGVLMTMAGGGSPLNFLLGGAALFGSGYLSHLIGVGALGALSLGPIFGMAALPVIATVSFFLRFLINAAETGQPFTIPGALMGAKMRFPTFTWVMTGVVFALLSGFTPWHENIAFFAWNMFGDPKVHWDKTKPWFKNLPVVLTNFNVIYAGLFLFAAATGFTAPATFLVLAFLPERIAHLTEFLLQKSLPASAATVSSSPAQAAPQTLSEKVAAKMPSVNRWLRTATFIGLMLGAAGVMGFGVFGIHQLLKVSVAAIVLSAIPFLFSAPLIKKMQNATDTTRAQDPAIYRVVDNLRALENANRPGKKPIPVPEVVILPTELPNAFATGPSPFHAMVGVTQGTKEMLLTPENLRKNLINAIAASNPEGDAFKVLRRTIAETIPGASEQDSPETLSNVVSKANASDIEKLGERYLRGVLAHEFTHVMDRHMLDNFVIGSVLSAINFAAYSLMWSVVVGHRIIKSILPKKQNAQEDSNSALGPKDEHFAPLAVPAIAALPALVRLFLALWAPVFLGMLQIAASRNNEAQADEGGARLVKDPQALAAALVLLTNWRPSSKFKLSEEDSLKLAMDSHLFTVSPAEQLNNAGLMAQANAQKGPALTRGDDWLFYLMIMNHPETPARIKELWQMSEALKAQGIPPAPMAGN